MKEPAKSSWLLCFGSLVASALALCRRGGTRPVACTRAQEPKGLALAFPSLGSWREAHFMLACEARGTPLLTTGRDCCHLLSLPPHRDTVCMAQPGLQPSRSSSSPACPIPRLLHRPWPPCHGRCHRSNPQPINFTDRTPVSRAGEFSLPPCRVPNPTSLLGQLQGSLIPVGCPGEDGETCSASFPPYFR